MTDNVKVTVATAGADVAAEDIGGVVFQRVKLLGGVAGDTTGLGAGGTIPVSVVGAVAVNTIAAGHSVQALVTGAVSISAMPAVSGTVTVNTIAAGHSVQALVTGAVSISAMPNVNTIAAGHSVQALVTGAVSISAMPNVNTIAAGHSVQVGGVHTVDVTTTGLPAASSTGLIVALKQGAIVTVNTLAAGHSVQALVTGAVSISAMPAVNTILAGHSVQALVTGAVSISAMPAVNTILAGHSVQALVTGAISISAMPNVNTVAAGASRQVGGLHTVDVTTTGLPSASSTALIVALKQGAIVTVNTLAAGHSVQALVTGAVSISAMPAVNTILAGHSVQALVTGPVSISAMPVVSMTGALVSIVSTVLGTVFVSQAGLLYTTTGVTTGTAQAVWIMNPTTVTVTIAGTTTGTISLLTIAPTVTQMTVGVTGLPVWLGMSQTMFVAPIGDAIAFSFTAVSAATVVTPAVCDVAYLATTAQTSMYVVPAGKVLIINGIGVIVQNTAASVGIIRGEVFVRASVSSSVTVGPVVAYAAAAALTSATNAGGAGGIGGLSVIIQAGRSVGLAYKVTGHTGGIIGFVISGYLV